MYVKCHQPSTFFTIVVQALMTPATFARSDGMIIVLFVFATG